MFSHLYNINDVDFSLWKPIKHPLGKKRKLQWTNRPWPPTHWCLVTCCSPTHSVHYANASLVSIYFHVCVIQWTFVQYVCLSVLLLFFFFYSVWLIFVCVSMTLVPSVLPLGHAAAQEILFCFIFFICLFPILPLALLFLSISPDTVSLSQPSKSVHSVYSYYSNDIH